MGTVYDVTTWSIPGSPSVTAYTDIGAVINSIIADIHANQTSQTTRPGAVIYIPPGHYVLQTRAVIDVSFLEIKGSGHGFTSLSIRYNSDTSGWVETIPGGSHIQVQNTDGNSEAFLVSRSGNPRLSSVIFRDFCLDGVSFTGNENSYTNAKVGIRVASGNDSFRIDGMGFVYLEHAIIVDNNDALSITNNVITECGNCVELTTSGQASKITNNLMGAGPYGYTIYGQGQFGLLVSGNNLFPRGGSLVYLTGGTACAISSNRFHAFYAGMVDLESTNETLITGNHFYRQVETYPPFFGVSNGRDDLYGLIHVVGNANMITSNYFDHQMAQSSVTPSGATPTIILITGGGQNNLVATNMTTSQVTVMTVVLDASTAGTIILDSGVTSQILAYTSNYTLRPTP